MFRIKKSYLCRLKINHMSRTETCVYSWYTSPHGSNQLLCDKVSCKRSGVKNLNCISLLAAECQLGHMKVLLPLLDRQRILRDLKNKAKLCLHCILPFSYLNYSCFTEEVRGHPSIPGHCSDSHRHIFC